MKKPFAAAATAALAAGLALGLGAAAPPPAAAAPYCGITWGSAAKSAPVYNGAQVKDLRTGRHRCYDRMVIELRYKVKGYDVRYVDRAHWEGTGTPMSLDGGADLQVIVKSPAYNPDGEATYTPDSRYHAADVSGYRTFQQIVFAGSFEGQSTFAVGTRARLPFRVMILDAPNHSSLLVVDVAHEW